MEKVFISFPMHGKSFKEALAIRDSMIDYLKPDQVPVDNLIEKPEDSERLYCLGEAIKKLGECDMALFHPEWQKCNGCCVEMLVAKRYGIPTKVLNKDVFNKFNS